MISLEGFIPIDLSGLEDRVSRSLHNLHKTQKVIVPLQCLIATQQHIDLSHLVQRKDGKNMDDLPFVVKDKERYYIHDGHHRICLAKLRGSKVVEVNLLVL